MQGEYIKYSNNPRAGIVSSGSFVYFDWDNQSYYRGTPSGYCVDIIVSKSLKNTYYAYGFGEPCKRL